MIREAIRAMLSCDIKAVDSDVALLWAEIMKSRGKMTQGGIRPFRFPEGI